VAVLETLTNPGGSSRGSLNITRDDALHVVERTSPAPKK